MRENTNGQNNQSIKQICLSIPSIFGSSRKQYIAEIGHACIAHPFNLCWKHSIINSKNILNQFKYQYVCLNFVFHLLKIEYFFDWTLLWRFYKIYCFSKQRTLEFLRAWEKQRFEKNMYLTSTIRYLPNQPLIWYSSCTDCA